MSDKNFLRSFQFLPRFSLLAGVGVICSLASVHAQQLTWTALSGDWTDDANWDGTAPVDNDTREIFFDSGEVNNNAVRTITFDIAGSEQVLRGGLWFSTRTTVSRPFIIDLQTKRLTLEGGTLLVSGGGGAADGPPRTIGMFQNGVVQVGTETTAASIQLGGYFAEANPKNTEYQLVFGANSVLDTVHTENIYVATESGDSGRTRLYGLDLSQAELRSRDAGGNVLQNTLGITGDMVVGFNDRNSVHGSTNFGTEGRIIFGAVEQINIGGDLVLGKYQRTSAGTDTVEYPVQGMLQFEAPSYTQPVQVNVGGNLELGVGDRSTGVINDTPDMEITIGSASDRSHIQLGYKNQSHGTTLPNGDTFGSVDPSGGTFDAWVTDLTVGVNTETRAGGSTTGVLNLVNSTLGTLDIAGDATIGQGIRARGIVSLQGGNAVSQNLIVGDATDTASVGRSLLSLNGTSWTVNNAFTVGESGDVVLGVVDNVINIDLTSDDPLDFTIATGGVISAEFNGAPGTGTFWALRQLGDQQDEFNAFLAGGENARLIGTGDYGHLAEVFFDGTHTYYGVMIPEPSAILLLGLAAGILPCTTRRRK